MKTNNKGFTLIELIMVIVILGILAAVAVPKFFNFASQAHAKSSQAFIGNVRSALNVYGANKAVTTGAVDYPNPASGITYTAGSPAAGTGVLDVILEEKDGDWFELGTTGHNEARFYYSTTGAVPAEGSEATDDVSYLYTYTTGTPPSYSLVKDASADAAIPAP